MSEIEKMSFYLKTREDFDTFKETKETKSVNFERQAKNLLEDGEVLFAETEDGYIAIRIRKGFGLSKGKSEVYVCTFGEPPQAYRNRNVDAGLKQFIELHTNGTDFFYVEGLR